MVTSFEYHAFSLPDAEDQAIALDALEQVGMHRFKDKPYTQLSGGETQLVLVARALAQKTPVLVMDEPTSHLDFHNELRFYNDYHMAYLCKSAIMQN